MSLLQLSKLLLAAVLPMLQNVAAPTGTRDNLSDFVTVYSITAPYVFLRNKENKSGPGHLGISNNEILSPSLLSDAKSCRPKHSFRHSYPAHLHIFPGFLQCTATWESNGFCIKILTVKLLTFLIIYNILPKRALLLPLITY